MTNFYEKAQKAKGGLITGLAYPSALSEDFWAPRIATLDSRFTDNAKIAYELTQHYFSADERSHGEANEIHNKLSSELKEI